MHALIIIQLTVPSSLRKGFKCVYPIVIQQFVFCNAINSCLQIKIISCVETLALILATSCLTEITGTQHKIKWTNPGPFTLLAFFYQGFSNQPLPRDPCNKFSCKTLQSYTINKQLASQLAFHRWFSHVLKKWGKQLWWNVNRNIGRPELSEWIGKTFYSCESALTLQKPSYPFHQPLGGLKERFH